MNLSKSPQRPKRDSKKVPGPITYELLKDERKFLGNRKRSIEIAIGKTDRKSNTKMERYMDVHIKSQRKLPDPTKYFTPIEKSDRFLSKSPTKLAQRK